MINTQINIIRQTHEDKIFLDIDNASEISINELRDTINALLEKGIDKKMIKTQILPNLGYKITSFPEEIARILDDK